MSEETLCVIITVLVIALMFVWVPILEFICPRCGRAIERMRQGGASRSSAPRTIKPTTRSRA